ncbi:MAG: DUF3450 domain-containing protein [Sinobacteraceae bacterium]|nr:DUF3450 domain-containing protein [Nevskiaceae bacterium]
MVKHDLRASMVGLLLAAACALPLPAGASTSLSGVMAASEQWLVAQADSQKRIDKLADQRESMAEEYRDTLRQADSLKLYIQQLKAQIKDQLAEMDTIREEERTIDTANIEILPLMQQMLATLKEFVHLDMPFLLKEREARIEKLEAMMPRADVTVSEKFRRIVEAYQIEIDYGRTIEAYSGQLGSKDVDFLRVGRVALLYQTPDGSETGYWDRNQKNWVVDNSEADDVRYGLKIARKQTAPDLLIAPVLAAAGGAQ